MSRFSLVTLIATSCVVVAPVAAAAQHPRGFLRQPTPVGEVITNVDISKLNVGAAPDAVDWSTGARVAVSAVKNQGQCGGCWAFSTTEGVESGVYMSTGTLPPKLSTEQLVDCEHRDLGCNGGDIPEAVRYLMKNGQDTDSDYPDESSKSGRTKKCTWSGKATVNVTGFSYAVPACTRGTCYDTDEDKLAAVLAEYGPLSICVNSGDGQAGDWQNYKGGVLTKSCEAKANLIDHCVQLVGYNKTASPPFWKVKNSWGTDWGEDGYIRLEYGNKNMCCVGCEAILINAKPL